MSINSLITDFLEYLEVEKGRSTLTGRNYDHYLRVFAGFAKKNGVEDPEKIDLELVRKFRLALNRGIPKSEPPATQSNSRKTSRMVKAKAERVGSAESLDEATAGTFDVAGANKQPLSKSTQNYYLIALRTFLKYLSTRNINTLSPEKIELAKTSERQITFLKDEELEEILAKPNLKTIQGLRDKAILDLLFSTGLRVSELCHLKKEDINLEKNEFSVKGKGGKIRVVFLDDDARESLKRYLSARNDKSEYLFVSYGHTNSPVAMPQGKITPRSVQRMIKKYSKAAGITKNVTPHVLRHSFATDLLMAGADLRSVQALLGHSSVTTTQIYTHVTDKHLGEVHQAFHGLRKKQNAPGDGSPGATNA